MFLTRTSARLAAPLTTAPAGNPASLRFLVALGIFLPLFAATAAAQTINLSVVPNVLEESSPATDVTITARLASGVAASDIKVTLTAQSLPNTVAFSPTLTNPIVSASETTIPAGSASIQYTIADLTPTDDLKDTADNVITFSGTAGGYTVNPATLTIRDNDEPPVLVLATVDGPKVNLTYDKVLSNKIPKTCQYTVLVGSAKPGISKVEIKGVDKTVTLTLGTKVKNGESVTAKYTNKEDTTDPSCANPSNVLDEGDNPAASFNTRSVTNVTPVPSITITGPDPVNGEIDACFTFSEKVEGFLVSEITVGNGTVSSLDSKPSDSDCPKEGNEAAYSAKIDPGESGTVTVDVAAGVATSVNSGTPNAAAAQYSATIDKVKPTVTISGPSGTVRSDFTITVIFSEDVTGFEETDIDLPATHGNLSDFTKVSASRYTARVTPKSVQELTIDIGAAVAKDEAGNKSEAADQYKVNVNKDDLSITITGPSSTQTGGAFQIEVEFSSTVGEGTFDCVPETIGDCKDLVTTNADVVGVAGGGSSYTITLEPNASCSGECTVTAKVKGNVVEDASPEKYPASNEYSVKARMGVTLTIKKDGTDPATDAKPDTLLFVFGAAVTGFTSGDISVTNGRVSWFERVSDDTSKASIKPTADGKVDVLIEPSSARTTATPSVGNQQAEISYDADVGPEVEITGSSGIVNGPFAVTITFDEKEGDITGFGIDEGSGEADADGPDIVVTNGTVASLSPKKGKIFTATISPTASGRTTVRVPAGVALDDAKNFNRASNTYSVDVNSDTPDGVRLRVDPDELTEGDPATRIEVTAEVRNNAVYSSDVIVSVKVDGSGDSDVVDFDADPSRFTITIPAGQDKATSQFTLTPDDDQEQQDDETITVSGTLSNGHPVTSDRIKLLDDDAVPDGVRLTIEPSIMTEDGGGVRVKVTGTVYGDPGAVYPLDRTVSVVSMGTRGEGAVDFEPIGNIVINIDALEESDSTLFWVTPINDNTDEVDEIITFTGTLDNGDPVTGTQLLLTDDDAAPTGITLSVTPTTVDEGAGATAVKVTATAGGSAFGTDQTVNVKVTGTGAAGAVGFVPVPDFTIVLPGGQVMANTTFTLTPEDDTADQTNETITISGTFGSPVTNATSARLTLTDDDAAPTGIALTADPATISERDGLQTITVTAAAQGGTTYGTDKIIEMSVDGSGLPGTVDFDPVSDFNLTLPAGEVSATATFALLPENDNVDEADETVTVTGKSDVGTHTTTVVITDDDATPAGITLAADPSVVDEGDVLTTIRLTATVTGATTYGTDQVLAVGVEPSGQEGVVTFRPVADFNLTVPAGKMSASRTFSLRPENNVVDQNDEIVYVLAEHGEDEIVTTILLTDDDAAPTGIDFVASPASVAENAGSTQVTVTAVVKGGTTYGSDKAVAVTVAGTGRPGVVGFADVSDFTLTVPATQGVATVTFTLTPVNNVIDESDETITVTGIAAGLPINPTATVMLTDDDAAPTGITIATDPASVQEDAGATTVTVTASVQGGTTYAFGEIVSLSVAGSGGVGVVGFGAVPAFNLIVEAGMPTAMATFTITPENNVIDESDETVTVSGTHLARRVAATMQLVDDDAAPTGVSLSVNPTSVGEGEGRVPVTVTATVEGGTTYAFEQSLDVNVGGSGKADVVGFEPVAAFKIAIPAGDATKTATFEITPVNNRKREGDETVSVKASHLGTTPEASLTIVDDDAPIARVTEVTSVILPELTRAMTASTVGAVSSRIARAGKSADEMTVNVGGHTSLASVVREYRSRRTLGGVPWQERIGASSFTMSPLAANGLAGRLTVWGQGDYRSLGGGGLGDVDWTGSMTGMHIGTDADLGSGVLLGLAVSRTGGSADYQYTGANQDNSGESLDGTFGTSMQSVHPYVSWSWAPGSNMWASAGIGAGTVEINDDEADEQMSDSRMIAAVVGASIRVMVRGGMSLDVKSEAWQSSVEVDDNGDLIDGSTVNVNRVRIGLESVFARRLSSGGTFAPFVELGLRSDGGDGETGFGVEVGGGVRYGAAFGLSAEGRGRALVAHGGDVQEWGFSGTLAYTPGGGGGEGLSMEVGTMAGTASGGLQRLWSDRMMTPRMSNTEPRLRSEIGYGMGIYRGVLRPYGGVEMSEMQGISTRLGTEYRIGPRFNVGVEMQHVALPGDESRSPMVRATVTLR